MTDQPAPPSSDRPHAREPHVDSTAQRVNWLRAAVLGANDGIISTAGLVVGVAGANASRTTLLVAGLAGAVAGALSMAGGEYVSVSTQRDTERALLAKERWELETMPEVELAELAQIYRDKGLSADLADRVARQLTDHDPLAAHAEAELHIDPDDLVSPTRAAVSSMIAFALGAALPLLSIVLPAADVRVPLTMVAVTLALALTGAISARLGAAPVGMAVVRTTVVGLLTMTFTWLVGLLVAPGLA